MKNKDGKKVFWVTNFSNRNVTLSDLYLSIPSMSSVNLLGKGYSYTEEELLKSEASGSIFNKKSMVKVRKVPPQMVTKHQITIDPNVIIPTRTNSIYEIKQENYEELNIEDDVLIESSESLKKD